MVSESKKTESNVGGLFRELIGANIPSWKYVVAYLLVFGLMFFFFWDTFVFSTIYAVIFVVLAIWAHSSGNTGLRIFAVMILHYGFSIWLFDWIPFLAAMTSVCLIRTFLHAVSSTSGSQNGSCHEV